MMTVVKELKMSTENPRSPRSRSPSPRLTDSGNNQRFSVLSHTPSKGRREHLSVPGSGTGSRSPRSPGASPREDRKHYSKERKISSEKNSGDLGKNSQERE